MDETRKILEQALPAFESWLRATVSDEVSKALEADRVRRQFIKRYTREEAAEMLGVCLSTLWAWTRDGKINAVKVGNKPMYTKEEIDRVLQK